MGRTGTGAKAGAVAGIVYGAIASVISYYTLLSSKAQILSTIQNGLPANSPLTPDQVYQLALDIAPIVAVVAGIVLGMVVGLVFGWRAESMPGRSYLAKGLSLGIMFWFLFSVLFGLGDLQYGVTIYLTGLATGIVPALIFGSLLGFLYGRFLPKSEPGAVQQ